MHTKPTGLPSLSLRALQSPLCHGDGNIRAHRALLLEQNFRHAKKLRLGRFAVDEPAMQLLTGSRHFRWRARRVPALPVRRVSTSSPNLSLLQALNEWIGIPRP